MPGMTGSNLALEVFRLRPHIPFIIWTGFSSTITQEEALAIGIKRFIQKPASNSALVSAIREVLDEKEVNQKE
jgi:two-component system cell cycle sensor histidine kinase/response regulator CckA